MLDMIKKIKFFIRIAGEPVRNLNDLKSNFLLQEVMELFRNGVLSRWLNANGYDEQGAALGKISPDAADNVLARSLVEVFCPEYPQEALDDALHYFHFQREQEKRCALIRQEQNGYANAIKGYHQSFKNLLAEVSEKRADFDFLCRAAIEFVDNYWELFQTNTKDHCRYIRSDAPCLFFPLLALGCFSTTDSFDSNLRDDINRDIQQALSDSSSIQEIYTKLSASKPGDKSENGGEPFGYSSHFHYVEKQIDSWDDLVQDRSRRIMVLATSASGHVRSLGTREDFQVSRIAQIFPVFSGLEYKDALSLPKLLYIDLPDIIRKRCDKAPLFYKKAPVDPQDAELAEEVG